MRILLLLLAAVTAMVLLLLQVAIAAEKGVRPITRRPVCLHECGNISVPFPFGMAPGCFLEGFQVTCNSSFHPPRAFLTNGAGWVMSRSNFSVDTAGRTSSVGVPPETSGQLELLKISAAESVAWAYSAVTSSCRWNATFFSQTSQSTSLDPMGPLSLSVKLNALVGVGFAVDVALNMSTAIGRFFFDGYGHGFSAAPTCQITEDGSLFAIDGLCSGFGCCRFPLDAFNGIPPGFEVFVTPMSNDYWRDYPCSYGMLVETTFYNFSRQDLSGHDVLPKRYPRGVPIVLDFAILNGSCPQPGAHTACVSGNSYCINTTTDSGAAYVCRCLHNYEGNPYISDGCQDINECDINNHDCPKGSYCKNTPGSYECPCKHGKKRDGEEGPCTDKFPLPAMIAVGLAALIVIIVLMVMAYQLLKLKRFYEKNGGPILEAVQNIRIYTQKDLKRITNNYKDIVGEGYFGKVYMGTLNGQKVVVKKTIKVNEDRIKEFTDEVTIQSGMRHRNIARLLGCCLQIDVPLLVYEFVEKGSLYDVLFKQRDGIPAEKRLRVAIGSAEGLSYMHSSAESTIRHGDVKSANILLDQNFTPKVSDFGTSRILARDISERANLVIGDRAYIDPVYMEEGILTQESDVYSFGIVLIELITRRAARYDENRTYVTNFVRACQENRTREFVDNDITEVDDIELLEMVSMVALGCLKSKPRDRLDMRQVEQRLQNIAQFPHHGLEVNFQGSPSRTLEDIPFLDGENEASGN